MQFTNAKLYFQIIKKLIIVINGLTKVVEAVIQTRKKLSRDLRLDKNTI